MTKAPRSRGKKAEQYVAHRLGLERVHKLGLASHDLEGWAIAEVKNYQRAPEVPYRELLALVAKAPDPTRLHLFIYKRPGWKNYVVCCLLPEFEDWYGTLHVPDKLKARAREELHDKGP